MSRRLAALAVGCIALAGFDASAEVIGLRFVVGETLGKDEPARKVTTNKLAGNVAALNDIFRNSQVNLSAEIVQISFAPIQHTDALEILDAMARERAGFEQLFGMADDYGADYTVAIIDKLMLRGKRSCGRAYAVNKTVAEIADRRRALAVIDSACGTQTLAHELGHLMGLNHGDKVDECDPGKGHKTAIAPYARGYAEGECNGKPGAEKFGTVMVGGWMKAINGDGHGNLPLFSNPRIRDPRCGLKGICGDPERGDAVRALNENARNYVHASKRKPPSPASPTTEHENKPPLH